MPMIDTGYVQRMARYNRWQNQNLYGVADALADKGMSNEGGGDGASTTRFFATDSPERFARVGAIFLGRPIDVADVELIDLRS